MPASMPPPSSAIPGRSGGSGPYIAGMILFAALIGGLLYWKLKSSPPPAPPPPTSVAQKQVETAPMPVNAPPPPPKLEEPDAGAQVDAGSKSGGIGTGAAPGGTGGGATGPCGPKCEGKSSSALNTSLRATAQSAQGCYQRALRKSEVSGNMTVSVQVGATGAVCSAAIVNDSVHSNEISQCVVGRFRGKSFPPPEMGCVTVNIPISFTAKQ